MEAGSHRTFSYLWTPKPQRQHTAEAAGAPHSSRPQPETLHIGTAGQHLLHLWPLARRTPTAAAPWPGTSNSAVWPASSTACLLSASSPCTEQISSDMLQAWRCGCADVELPEGALPTPCQTTPIAAAHRWPVSKLLCMATAPWEHSMTSCLPESNIITLTVMVAHSCLPGVAR